MSELTVRTRNVLLIKKLNNIRVLVDGLEYAMESGRPSAVLDLQSPIDKNMIAKEEVRRWCDKIVTEIERGI